MSKLKKPRKSRFGEAPPPIDDVPGNLNAPETAPFGERTPSNKADGRALRATGRTEPFATRVSPEWRSRINRISKETGLRYVEILEQALDAFERTSGRNK